MEKINVRSPYYITTEEKPTLYYALQKCEDSSIDNVSEQTIDDIALDNDDRVQDSSLNDYVVIGKVDITTGSYTSVGLVTDTGQTGCPVPPDPVYYSLKKCDDQTTNHRSEQETSEIALAQNDRVTDSNGLIYIVTGETTSGNSVGSVTSANEINCPTPTPIEPPIIPLNCDETYNTGIDVGDTYYTFNTIETGNINIDITGNDVPVKFTAEWNNTSVTTNYIGLNTYDQDLLDLGIPQGEIATGNHSTKNNKTFTINKSASTPEQIIVRAYAPLVNDEYSININCPEPPAVIIENTTQINIWFDNSGSMDDTLAPLQSMVANDLKSCLIQFYNNDSDDYDRLVKVRNMGEFTDPLSERTLYYAAQEPDVSGATNCINIIFQDEANQVYTPSRTFFQSGRTPQPTFLTDLAQFRGVYFNNPTGYITPILFQVNEVNPINQAFYQFTTAIFEGSGQYYGSRGVSDIPNFKLYQQITYSSTSIYYRNLIVQAFNDLGFNLTC